jgi:hypothetical protein
MTAVLQVAEMLAIIAALVTAVGALLYGLSWLFLSLVRFFPAIGKSHRHERWNELTRRSGRH